MNLRPSATTISRYVLLGSSILLFVVSLPGWIYANPDEGPFYPDTGGYIWLGVDNIFKAWLAFPSLVAAWVLLFRRRPILALGLVAFAMAITLSIMLDQKIAIVGHGHGRFAAPDRYGIGYWLWIGSIAITAVQCVVDICCRVIDATRSAAPLSEENR
jgi:hypothetical protein